MKKPVTVFVTVPGASEAKKIVSAVLEKKLAACASVIGGVRSMYWWKGKLERSNESLIILKTDIKHFKKLASEIKRMHSYKVPEIVALPIIDGDPDYLEWIGESVR